MTEDQVLDIDLEEDRYHRLRLIPWWDQERLFDARVMVAGAGALGNEILKQLALLGVGNIFVVDMDIIEESNLTRAVLFRKEDEGQPKAEVAARALMALNPEIRVQSFVGNIVYDVGAGVFADMDIVIGALDNREARVAINQACWQLGKPFVDGAIEIIQGVARIFCGPDGPCYECTMNAKDYELLSQRRSCALLSRDDLILGKVPTTPTTAAIIAGIQTQEAVKWLHRDREMPLLLGRGLVYDGFSNETYIVEYQRRADCPAHITLPPVQELDKSADTATVGEMLELVRSEVSPEAVLEFEREICIGLHCPHCHESEPVFRSLGKLTESEGRCPHCHELREPELTHAIYGDEDYLDRTLAEMGLPLYDIVTGRDGLERAAFLLAADRETALGCLA